MTRWADDAIGRVRLNRRYRIVVRFVFREKIGAKNRFGNFLFVFVLKFSGRNFRQIIQRRATSFGAKFVDNFFAHERADADIAVSISRNGMAHHRVDADEAGSSRNLDFAHHRAGATENVSEFSRMTIGDGDLIHDAAWRADDMIFRHLTEPRDARTVELQIQIRIEAAQCSDFHGGGTADADVHRHGAQK